MTCGACVEGNIFFHVHVLCFFHTVTALSKRLLQGAQHWIIQTDEQTWAAPSNLAPRGTAKLQLELRVTPLPPVPLGCVVLQSCYDAISCQAKTTGQRSRSRECAYGVLPHPWKGLLPLTLPWGIECKLHSWVLMVCYYNSTFTYRKDLANACPTLSRGESRNTLCVFLNTFLSLWNRHKQELMLLLWARK